jgi:Pentapeptide repeats (8 copies)
MAIALTDEVVARLLQIVKSDESFNELVKIAHLDPKDDFQDQDLSHIDFGQADLRGFSFKGANLSHSNLEDCVVDATTDFTNAILVGTRLPPGFNRQDAPFFLHVVFIAIDPKLRSRIEQRIDFLAEGYEFHDAPQSDHLEILQNIVQRSLDRLKMSGLFTQIVVVDQGAHCFDAVSQAVRAVESSLGQIRQQAIAVYYVVPTSGDSIMHGPFHADGYMPKLVQLSGRASNPDEIAKAIGHFIDFRL